MTSKGSSLSMTHFTQRRAQLMEQVGNGAIIIAAGHDANRNHDVDYEFRQQSSFWYLTGFDEPDAVAVLRPDAAEKYVLFIRPFDPKFEIWVGPRAGVGGAVKDLGADAAYSIEQLKEELPKLLTEADTIYFSLGSDAALDGLVSEVVKERRAMSQRGGKQLRGIMDIQPAIDRMRLLKTEDEVVLMQRAIDITAQGFQTAIRASRPGIYEYQVQAEMEAEFRRLGSPRNGYPSIVASGPNSCILHYIKNRQPLQDGDLLLIDAGAEFEYYTADVTRTWPVNGKFTPEQKAAYEVVLEAQRQAIAKVVPGVGFDEVHQTALRVLVQGLIDFGALQGEIDGLIEQDAYRPYYMHGTSHWLGLDAHDAGQYRNEGKVPIKLEPGMVLTVEPGLYFGSQAAESPAHLKGIGIRIEDDVLVTPTGCRALSEDMPKGVEEMESLVGAARS